MEISSYNRIKISSLNAICILLVLLLHSYYVEAEQFPLANAVQLMTGTNGISSIAVPLFFFISGLLFFKNVLSIKDCIGGIKKRVRTLLVPYLIWNIVFVCWFLVMAVIPGVSRFVNSDIFIHFSLEKPLEGLRFLFVEPAAFHLWFLRDLMLYVITTPLLYPAVNRKPFLTLFFLVLLFGWVPRCGIAYFYFGALIALHSSDEKINLNVSDLVVLLCAIVFFGKCMANLFPSIRELMVNPYIQQITCFCGIIMSWSLYDRVVSSCKWSSDSKVLSIISRYSFFIYLFHEPVFNIIKKLSLMVAGISDISLIALYFVNPVIMALLSVLVGYFIQKYLPKVYAVMVGGR